MSFINLPNPFKEHKHEVLNTTSPLIEATRIPISRRVTEITLAVGSIENLYSKQRASVAKYGQKMQLFTNPSYEEVKKHLLISPAPVDTTATNLAAMPEPTKFNPNEGKIDLDDNLEINQTLFDPILDKEPEAVAPAVDLAEKRKLSMAEKALAEANKAALSIEEANANLTQAA